VEPGLASPPLSNLRSGRFRRVMSESEMQPFQGQGLDIASAPRYIPYVRSFGFKGQLGRVLRCLLRGSVWSTPTSIGGLVLSLRSIEMTSVAVQSPGWTGDPSGVGRRRISDHAGTRRAAMRVLDACLNDLEDAAAAGATVVGPDLAARLAPHLPVAAGMPIPAALETAFKLQRACMSLATSTEGRMSAARHAVPDPPCAVDTALGLLPDASRTAALSPSDSELSLDDARELTRRIKQASGAVSPLLLEAHDRKAWRALGYGTWELYVRHEFGMSRSRSYELLDHARVLRTLRAATGRSGIPDISPYAASQLKPRLSVVVSEVERASERDGEQAARAIIEEALTRAQGELGARRGQPGDVSLDKSRSIWDMTARLVRCIASTPPELRSVSAAPRELRIDPRDAEVAARWLAEVAERLIQAEAV
jgi:hypothetical protein